MDGQTNRLTLGGQSSLDRLLDPPGSVGRELSALIGIETFDSLHQANVSLGNQIEERKSIVGVVLRDFYDKAQVCLNHVGASFLVADLNSIGELNLFFPGE